MEKRYRLVANFGYGDKTWLDRDLSLDSALVSLSSSRGWEVTDLESAEDQFHNYYIELDDPSDEEDWDWMDS